MVFPHTYLRAINRVFSSILVAVMVFGMPGLTLRTALADVAVVSGTVTTTTAVAVSGAVVELHTPDGLTSFNTTTAGDGTYSFSQVLGNGTAYVVEVRAPVNYVRVTGSFNFTYSGSAQTGVNFTLMAASKTISGTVVDTNGTPITDADINIEPYNNSSTSERVSARTNGSGAWSATVVGGTWFAQAVVNLSEYTPRWIAEESPFRIDFANDATSESTTHTFTVTPATGKATVLLKNSDGNILNTSGFEADIAFRRVDGVGTVRKVRGSTTPMSVYLTPGIYSISAFHQDLAGKSFDPDETTFTITDGADVDLGTITAVVNSAHLKGKVTNGKNAIPGVQLEAIRAGGSERANGNTDSAGNYDLTVGPGTWTVGVKNFNSNGQNNATQYSQVAPVSTKVTNGQTTTGLNIVLKNIDRHISGNIINSDGALLTDYVGTAFVKTIDKKFKAIGSIEAGHYTIDYSTADISGKKVYVGVEAADGSPYTGSSLNKITIAGANTTKNIAVIPFNSTMSGALLLSTGTEWVAPGSVITVDAVDENGNFSSVDVNSNGTFTLPLAKGTWYYDYTIDDTGTTNGLINRAAGQNKITIGSGQAVSGVTLSVLKGTNTIAGRVTQADGVTPVGAATVTLDNGPKGEDSSTTSAGSLITVSVLTNSDGQYSALVPNGTYLVTVGMTPDVPTNQLAPDSSSLAVTGGGSYVKNFAFETTDATVTGKVKTKGKVDGGGTITAFSDDGAQVTGQIDTNGNYSLALTKNEAWHLQATDLSGKNLLQSEQLNFKPKAGTQTKNIDLKDSGLDLPGPSTKSCASDEVCAVSLPDGTSVTVPAFGIDITGNVTLTVTPTIDMSKTTTDQPASLTYEVKATDHSGNEIKKLNKDAEITIPYDQNIAAKQGLLESRLSTAYYDPISKKWADSGSAGLVDTKNNLATISTDHFTKFSITGMAKLRPNLNSYKTSIRGNLVTITITGSSFTSKITATAGSIKAKSATVSGSTATITFDLKKVGRNATKTITVTNSNGRSFSYSQKMTTNGRAKGI